MSKGFLLPSALVIAAHQVFMSWAKACLFLTVPYTGMSILLTLTFEKSTYSPRITYTYRNDRICFSASLFSSICTKSLS